MSIIERSNPINLQYRVCIVTCVSTPLSTVICKTLLKANALVVGIDSRQKDDSLNANRNTHFQFIQKDVSDQNLPEEIMELARTSFPRERVDILVNVIEQGKEAELQNLRSFTQAIGKVMQKERHGSIVNVVGAIDDGLNGKQFQPIIDFTNEINAQFQKDGIRCNVIGPQSEGGRHSKKEFETAKSQMTEIMQPQKTTNPVEKPKVASPKYFDVSNLTLFLASDMSEQIAGSHVRLDGSYD